MTDFHPMESLAELRHEFGEHGGANMSIETSTTFTVMQAETLPKDVPRPGGTRRGWLLPLRSPFQPTIYVLGRQIAALEGAEGNPPCRRHSRVPILYSILSLDIHSDRWRASTCDPPACFSRV